MNTKPYHLSLLATEFRRRIAKNPRYSLRAFARQLGLHPSALSRVLSGKQDLSIAASHTVIDALGVSDETRRLFLISVSRERVERQLAHHGESAVKPAATEVSPEIFNGVADVTCMSVLEACALDDADVGEAWFADRLGLSVNAVRAALRRLEAAGFVEPVGKRWVKAAARFSTQERALDLMVLQCHQREIGEKAVAALTEVPYELRCITSMMTAMDPAKVPRAKQMIGEFLEQLGDFLASERRTALYQVNVQFFPVTKVEPEPDS